MKKWILWLLIGAMLLGLFGCTTQKQEFEYPINFYYLPETYTFGVSDSVLVQEQREGNGMENDLYALLSLYLKGPASPELRSPFPAGTAIVLLEQADNTLHITLSEEFAALHSAKLTLACAAIAKTCLELTDCVNVQISAENATLNGEKFIVMNASSLLLLDNAEPTTTTPTE